MAEKIACPACRMQKNRVKETDGRSEYIRRRRVCLACGHAWSTYEICAAEFKKLRNLPRLLERLRALSMTAVKIEKDVNP